MDVGGGGHGARGGEQRGVRWATSSAKKPGALALCWGSRLPRQPSSPSSFANHAAAQAWLTLLPQNYAPGGQRSRRTHCRWMAMAFSFSAGARDLGKVGILISFPDGGLIDGSSSRRRKDRCGTGRKAHRGLRRHAVGRGKRHDRRRREGRGVRGANCLRARSHPRPCCRTPPHPCRLLPLGCVRFRPGGGPRKPPLCQAAKRLRLAPLPCRYAPAPSRGTRGCPQPAARPQQTAPEGEKPAPGR